MSLFQESQDFGQKVEFGFIGDVSSEGGLDQFANVLLILCEHSVEHRQKIKTKVQMAVLEVGFDVQMHQFQDFNRVLESVRMS